MTLRKLALLVVLLGALSLAFQGMASASDGPIVTNTVKRLISIGEDGNEFKNIFHYSPSAAEESRNLDDLHGALAAGLTPLRATATQTAAQQFWNNYRAGDFSAMTLVGHNDGGFFRMPDGSEVNLNALTSSDGPILAVISCESTKYVDGSTSGVPDPLTYVAAYNIEQRYRDYVTASPDPITAQSSAQYLQQAVNAVSAEMSNQRKVRIVTVSAIGGGAVTSGVGIYAYQQ